MTWSSWAMLVSITLAIATWYFFARSERARWARVLVMAVSDDQGGRYESACYHYAIARSAGGPAHICEPRIRELWRTHGPFLFAEQDGASDRACRYHSCGRGHHELIVSDIQRLVGEATSESALS